VVCNDEEEEKRTMSAPVLQRTGSIEREREKVGRDKEEG